MIRNGDLTARVGRMADRIREVGSLLPTDKVRREQDGDPLGLGLTYPVMFMAYDVERGQEVPLSGLIHEDDPNLVVVSLVAESIAEETQQRAMWRCTGCATVTSDPDDPFILVHGIGDGDHKWTQDPTPEIVYVMEVWS